VEAELVLDGALDEAHVDALREAARSCRISRALAVPVALTLRLAGAGGEPAPR
jgi:hypothetical protein